ncbi:MAG: hypothetical protein AAF696_14555 [Bacteroidota bacterium]
MHRILLPLLLIVLCLACKKEKPEQASPFQALIHLSSLPEKEAFDLQKHLSDYRALRKRIATRKPALRTLTIEKRQDVFFHTLVDSIFPYWYGTEWDFNGITETPRKGEIACGYFVSTTLKHMGLGLNRYKLAQKAAYDILKDLSKPGSIKRFTDFKKMLSYLSKEKEDCIYLLGLDYHVGFVVKKKQELYFIPSNYFSDKVEQEHISDSYSAASSQAFYLGNLSANSDLLKKWVK